MAALLPTVKRIASPLFPRSSMITASLAMKSCKTGLYLSLSLLIYNLVSKLYSKFIVSIADFYLCLGEICLIPKVTYGKTQASIKHRPQDSCAQFYLFNNTNKQQWIF